MIVENKKVAIIGGGPGGLTLARLLQLKGVSVTVYERDVTKEARVQGATLDLHFESGLKALEAAGLTEEFKANYRPGADKGRIVDKQATIVYDEHTDEPSELVTDDFGQEWFRPEIDRGPLRNLLLASLQPGTVVWDAQLVSLSPLGDGWELVFKNGTIAVADIIVGADGANSKIRPLVTPIKPFYSGTTIMQGNVDNAEVAAPHIYQLLKGGKLYAYDGANYIHVSSKGDGSIDFYVSSLKDEHWRQASGINFSDREQVVDWFKKEFAGWDSIWFELVETVHLPLLIRPQYCVPFDQCWDAHSSVTLLGDAAHIMPPSGEGVNLAMLDALELSECLTSGAFQDRQTAIAAYEKPMLVRAAQEAQHSLEMAAWMHAEGALEKMVQMFGGIS